jgi:hypothetical protein
MKNIYKFADGIWCSHSDEATAIRVAEFLDEDTIIMQVGNYFCVPFNDNRLEEIIRLIGGA